MSERILFQHGTLGALMAGLMDGTETIEQILKHGTLGLGTLHGLDGEVIFLDGEAYQGRSDGVVVKLTGKETTPYAASPHSLQMNVLKSKIKQKAKN